MNQKSIFALSAFTTLLTLSSTSVMSAGFQQDEYSATGLGRAYAGEAAMADNPSAQFRNPAMLSYLPKTQVSTGLVYKNPNIDVKGTTTSQTGERFATFSDNYAASSIIPNLYVSHQLNEQFFLGLGIASSYAMESKLDTEFQGTQFGSELSIRTVEVNPNLAYRINQQLSVGGGIRLVFANASLAAKSAGGASAIGTVLKEASGNDLSYGWQLGGAWQINPHNRIGMNYRSGINLNLEGNAAGETMGFSGQLPSSMALTLPATFEISSFHQINKKIALHSSINWTDWSRFKQIDVEVPSFSASPIMMKEHDWVNSYRIAIGSTYRIDKKTRVRTGIAYDLSAANSAQRSIIMPEADRAWFSAGLGYDYSRNLTLDFAFNYIKLDSSDINEPRPCFGENVDSLHGGQFSGDVSGHTWSYGMQANYRF